MPLYQSGQLTALMTDFKRETARERERERDASRVKLGRVERGNQKINIFKKSNNIVTQAVKRKTFF